MSSYKVDTQLFNKYLYRNPEEQKKYSHAYYLKNKEKIKLAVKKWKEENPDRYHKYLKEWAFNNKDKVYNGCVYKYSEKTTIRNREYRKNNPEKVKEWQSRRRLKIKSSSFERMKNSLRYRIYIYVKIGKYRKNTKTEDILGCEWNTIKKHLESQFTYGMSWDNYGYTGWHIDHIIPLATAKNQEELDKLFHYKNLQPLWAGDNMRKHCRLS